MINVILCEQWQKTNMKNKPIVLESNFTQPSSMKTVVCSSNHNVVDFMQCMDHCGANHECRNRKHFQCEDGISSIPYTLVCDTINNCPRGFDERFCVFPSCPGKLIRIFSSSSYALSTTTSTSSTIIGH